MINPDDSIHPFKFDTDRHTTVMSTGLSMREHFAGLAMQGFLSNPNLDRTIAVSVERVSEYSVKAADTLIAELNKFEEKLSRDNGFAR